MTPAARALGILMGFALALALIAVGFVVSAHSCGRLDLAQLAGTALVAAGGGLAVRIVVVQRRTTV